jgi:hypothetical protein
MICVAFVSTVVFLSVITRLIGRHIGTQSNIQVVTRNAWYSFAILTAQGDWRVV